AGVVPIVQDQQGNPLNVGRKTRSIPSALRRALIARDRSCRFPGCTHTRFLDTHHIQHWAKGGATSLANTLLLCSRHHTLVHEGRSRVPDEGCFGPPRGEEARAAAAVPSDLPAATPPPTPWNDPIDYDRAVASIM